MQLSETTSVRAVLRACPAARAVFDRMRAMLQVEIDVEYCPHAAGQTTRAWRKRVAEGRVNEVHVGGLEVLEAAADDLDVLARHARRVRRRGVPVGWQHRITV